MLIKNIRILDEISDIESDSIDVCVDSEDGYTFIVSIATTKYLLQRMDEEKSNVSKPNELIIVVRKLTQEIITEAIEAYAKDNAFWLKLYAFANEIDSSVFDELQAKHVKESIEFNILSGLDDLEKEINEFDKLNNAEKSNLVAKIGNLKCMKKIVGFQLN